MFEFSTSISPETLAPVSSKATGRLEILLHSHAFICTHLFAILLNVSHVYREVNQSSDWLSKGGLLSCKSRFSDPSYPVRLREFDT